MYITLFANKWDENMHGILILTILPEAKLTTSTAKATMRNSMLVRNLLNRTTSQAYFEHLTYSKHSHITTLISGFRLIVFLFAGV